MKREYINLLSQALTGADGEIRNEKYLAHYVNYYLFLNKMALK